jgi:peptide methionine sulfoxide reductase MsrB
MTDTEERRKAIPTGVIREVRVSCCTLSQDEILVHYFEQELKKQSMERYCITSPRKKKGKTVLSAGKILAVFLGGGNGEG